MTTNGDTRTGHWGELMTNAALLHGCNGAVVDGGIRDSAAVEALDFPVFYRFTCAGDALGRFNITAYECTVECAGVVVNPGDFIFGDRDGVVVVPKHLTEQVLEDAEKIAVVENEIRGRIRNGESVAMLYTQYEQF
jgi:regulator of RNase E activity RraA